MVNVQVVLTATLDEIRPLVIPQVAQAIAEAKLTEPNAVVQGFNIADQHYQNPTVLLDPNQLTLTCESEPGQPFKLLIQQPVLIEAHKKEARIRHAVFPLTHIGDFETADEHAKLASGTIHIHASLSPVLSGAKVADTTLTLQLLAQAVDLKPETNLGQAVPLPGIKDLIQNKFKEKLGEAQNKTTDKTVVVKLSEKVPAEYKDATLNKAEATTNKDKTGIEVKIDAAT